MLIITDFLKLVRTALPKTAHPLLVSIQNVDENSHDPDISAPTLSLSYDKNGLRVDYNEIGFSVENVDALCIIGQSTKFGMDCQKWISSHPVFKAANVL